MCGEERKGVNHTSPGTGAELRAFCTLIHNNLSPIPSARERGPAEACDTARFSAQVHPTLPSLLPAGPKLTLVPARGRGSSASQSLSHGTLLLASPNLTAALCSRQDQVF